MYSFTRPAPKKATARWKGDRAKQAERSAGYREFRSGKHANRAVPSGTVAYEPKNSDAWHVQRW